MFRLLTLSCTLLPYLFSAEVPSRWHLAEDGGIAWAVTPGDVHQDQIEMSGRLVSVIVTYGVRKDGSVYAGHQLVFPSLRTVPNDTHASLSYTFAPETAPRIFVDGRPVRGEVATRLHHRGLLTMESVLGRQKEVHLTRTVFPSTRRPAAFDLYTFRNESAKAVQVEVEETVHTVTASAARGVDGAYLIESKTLDAGVRNLAPGAEATFAVVFYARPLKSGEPIWDQAAEQKARAALVDGFLSKLQLETPDAVLNTAFSFAKIRATESIYDTVGGLMHGPGGGAYYAAIWANDQAEYANPFFPFLGNAAGNESAINAYRHFARYVNAEYKPIPSSIIAGGVSFWNGAGDRGDMAMIAYGASRFALAYGDEKTARELWPLIEWCLEYCKRKVTAQGVVASDSDELEGRFPAGKANLSTSSLYYDALHSAALLGKQLGRPQAQLADYADRAKAVRTAIESYFGAEVSGFHTYRYYDGNTVLRSWICIPLAMGIADRAQGTIDALFSPTLWTVNGLATQAGDKTFWDRSTLYALRGVLAAGATEKAMEFLTYYSRLRLLGEHVPYPVEAWPEGNQRHLAAESALYCRIFTEGLFGIRPTGLRSFTVTPRLPKGWPGMKLKGVQAFGRAFDLAVTRAGAQLKVVVTSVAQPPIERTISDGATTEIQLSAN
ncbi:hypothetical protein [uncultured Paludibaculum sp.]|uniref:hypothetical protein n=1 Tax=uncultured Paludibaculum sp. TaxID=1765020 RepID=UPI002AAC1F14|nr:hypothetical protein [uncultured Paludibaculum sp.]